MPLELRPNCELCGRDLPPNSTEARICSYECTYCAECADTRLFNVCPNCGGDCQPRPIRPSKEWRAGLSVHRLPPSTARKTTRYTATEIEAFVTRLRAIPPAQR